MKFKVTLKNPDALNDAAMEAASESLSSMDDISSEEKDNLIESRAMDYMDVAGKWFEYSEYVTVEIDTEAKTCTVIPVSV